MPAFVSKLSSEQWAEARRLRAEGATFAAIAARFGMSAQAIATRARKDVWATSGSVIGAKPAKGRARVPSPATADIRHRLALRLYHILEIEICMLELRMSKELEAYKNSSDLGLPAAANKEVREHFAALIERFKQVTEMDSEPASAADGRRKSVNRELTALSPDIDPDGLAIASEKDQFRAEIAERLGKLFPHS